MTAHARHRLRGDTGAATVWMIFGTVIIFAVAGLVFDGGLMINAKQEAINQAEAAARAGAQQVDVAGLYSQGAPRSLDPTAAAASANAYIATHGWVGTATADTDSVTVTITQTQRMTFLQMFGLGDRQITGTATAHPEQGFAGP